MKYGTIFKFKEEPDGPLYFNYLDRIANNVYYMDPKRGPYFALESEVEVVDIGEDEAYAQQILTHNVLTLIDRKFPKWKPLVSGGAPRDWDVGTPANDIDVWRATPTDQLGREVEAKLKGIFGYRAEIKLVSPKDYPTGEGYIEYIYSATIVGLEFQFIFVTNNSVQAVHNHVCASLSRIHFDYKTLTLHPTLNYKGSRKQKCIHYYDDKGCSPRVSYVLKMKKRYPLYKHDFSALGDPDHIHRLEQL